MSIRVMNAVWRYFTGPRHLLLPLLALADFADDDGLCWPAIATVAHKVRLTRRQTQYALHQLIKDGWVEVTDNSLGGAHSATRRYRIQIDRLTDEVQCTGEAACTGEPGCANGCNGPRERMNPTSPKSSLTIKNHHSLSGLSPDRASPAKTPKASDLQSQAISVLNFLNQKTNRSFRALDGRGKPTAALRTVMDRLRTGVSVEDCRSLVALKIRQWSSDDKMRGYLRPSTLFRASNFEDYLGELHRDGGES